MPNFKYPNNFDDDFINTFKKVLDYLNEMGYTYEESLKKAREILDEAQKTNDMNESVQQQINTLIAESGTSDAEVLQARIDAEGNEYDVLKERLDGKEKDFNSHLAQKVNNEKIGGLHPAKLTAVKVEEGDGNPRVLDVFGGFVWADDSNGNILKRPQDGGDWVIHTTRPTTGGALRLLPTDDDEVLLLNGNYIYKSTNFFEGNTSWEIKLTANDSTHFIQWGFDGYKNKFIATSYYSPRTNSRYAWISLDNGENWDVAYDTVALHGEAYDDITHMHAVCYDRWGDRFYLSDGHGDYAGVYISDDDGQTWVTNEKLKQNPAPTVMVATPDGIVCGSDNRENGLYGIVRQEKPSDEELQYTWRWNTGVAGLVGFAQRGFYDENSGLVYVSFRIDQIGLKPVIAAGTPTSGALVYEWDSGGALQDSIINVVVPNKDELIAHGKSQNYSIEHSFTAKIVPPGAAEKVTYGNYEGGKAEGNSIAIGKGSEALGIRSMALGTNAKTKEQDSIVIGYGSVDNNGDSVVIGSATQSSSNSVVIGNGIISDNSGVVIIGKGSEVLYGGDSVVIGEGISSRASSVVIGRRASSNRVRSVVVGTNASAENNMAVSLGYGSETTADNQVALGARHIELGSDGGGGNTVPDGSLRLFARDNDGVTELCVKIKNTIHVVYSP